jgi:hypothetical protein
MTRTLTTIGAVAALAVLVAGAADAKTTSRRHTAAKPAAAPATVLHISSHLAEGAQVSVDGKPAVTAPGYGSTVVGIAAGHHTLKVSSSDGVAYQGDLDLKPGDVMSWRGKGYWCVNLLENALEPYSKDECQEDVTDAG